MYTNASGTVSREDSPPEVPATRERVYARTRQLVANAGRHPHQITKADYDQAIREVTGTSDRERQEAVLDAAERQYDPRPGECETSMEDDRRQGHELREGRERKAS